MKGKVVLEDQIRSSFNSHWIAWRKLQKTRVHLEKTEILIYRNITRQRIMCRQNRKTLHKYEGKKVLCMPYNVHNPVSLELQASVTD